MLNNNFSDFSKVENDKFFSLVYTNLSHEFLLSFVWMKLLRFNQENRDMRRIKDTQKLKLGDAQGTPR